MGCFEDYMQFRDEVNEVKKKILVHGAGRECRCKEGQIRNDENTGNP